MKTKNRNWQCLAGLLSGIFGWAVCCSQLTAAGVNVDIINYAFSPSAVTIQVNDQVQWTWLSNYHSTTSNNGLWDSGVYNMPYSFAYTFASAGNFPYYCSYHGFTGSVTVKAVSVPPTVTITNPPSGEVLTAPASLTLKATAAVSNGSVTNVKFFQGSTLLGGVASAPYSFAVAGLAAGSYTFSAVATDNGGLSATNSITVQVVNPVSITLNTARRSSQASFQFTFGANVGLRYVVEQSGDLKNWIGISTNTAATNEVLFQDNSASGSQRFYRVGRLPNP